MGFKLVEAVYRLDRDATSSSEQAVLLALAFRANDKTLLCYPKQETLAEMTHLRRSTVAIALNNLRQKGFLDWKSGGIMNKRGKHGQPLSNDYRLKLPSDGEKGKIQAQAGVRQSDTAVSGSWTQRCPAVGHSGVRQSDTNRNNNRQYITDTEQKRFGVGIGL